VETTNNCLYPSAVPARGRCRGSPGAGGRAALAGEVCRPRLAARGRWWSERGGRAMAWPRGLLPLRELLFAFARGGLGGLTVAGLLGWLYFISATDWYWPGITLPSVSPLPRAGCHRRHRLRRCLPRLAATTHLRPRGASKAKGGPPSQPPCQNHDTP